MKFLMYPINAVDHPDMVSAHVLIEHLSTVDQPPDEHFSSYKVSALDTSLSEDEFDRCVNLYWDYPQLAAGRVYPKAWNYVPLAGKNAGIIVELLGQKFKIDYHSKTVNQCPIPGIVEFELLTPEAIETSYIRTEVFGPQLQLFGQPIIYQDNIFYKPPQPGWQMYLLFSHSTLWGDSGTENVFMILDDKYVIRELVWEASCH
jgi:hypothetical protein